MFSRLLFASLVVLGLSGCATKPTDLDKASVEDVVKGIALDQAPSSLDKAVTSKQMFNSLMKTTKENGYVEWTDVWQWGPESGIKNPIAYAEQELRKFCAIKGGSMDRNVCLSQNTKEPLFFAQVSPNDRVVMPTASILRGRTVVPSGGSYSKAYMARLYALGFRTDEQKFAEKISSRVAADMDVIQSRLDAQSLLNERPLKQKKGVMVCLRDRRWLFRGAIDDVAEDRIKVLVMSKQLDSLPPQPYQEIVWASIDDWRLCP